MNMKQLACCFSGIVGLLGTLLSAVAGQPAFKESDSLVAQGEAFQNAGQTGEALAAYRQAAKAGNVKGAFAAGEILITQGQAGNRRDQVLKLSEGIGYLFVAATNRQPQACARIADVFQSGIGIQTNLVGAYAWLKYAAQLTPRYKADLDRLVVQLKPDDVVRAQVMADEFAAGHWPDRIISPVDEGDPRLSIQGVSVSNRGTLVILNGSTITAGDTVDIFPAKRPKHIATERLTVSCFEIGDDYMLLAVAGEPNLKMLTLEPH